MIRISSIALGTAAFVTIGLSSSASAQEVMTRDAPAATVARNIDVTCQTHVLALESQATGQTSMDLDGSVLTGADADTVNGFLSEPASAVRTSFRCNESGEILGYLTRASEKHGGGVLYEKLSFIVSESQVSLIELIEVGMEDFFYK